MKADTVDLAAIFGNQVRYMVPLYQRPYVWTREDQWEPLWQDVQAVADRQLDDSPANDSIPHFLGAVVLEQALVQTGKINTRSVIDGQQRLTTLQLLLAAARSVAADHGLDDARQTFEKLLLNESFLVKHDGYPFKVLPTQRDQAAFREAMQDGVGAATGDHRMHEAYRFFRDAISEWATDGTDGQTADTRIDALSTVLWKLLVIVTIDLDPGDNAQVIFETLNARGTPLLAGDLIKNHLFQVATIQGAPIDRLYEEHWKALDNDWWRDEVQQGRLRRPRLDVFLNHWLAMRTGAEVVSHDLFPAFKRYLAAGQKAATDVLGDLVRYGRVYESFEKEPSQTALGRFLYRLGVMEVTTAYPALLWLLGPEGIADEEERRVALRAIESWLVRRMLVRGTTKNYNVVFLALLKAVRSGGDGSRPTGAEVEALLAGLTGDSQYWPTDGQVRASLRGLPVYRALTRSRLRMVLEALEEALYTEYSERVILPHDLTVEHVLPQEWGAHWSLPAGEDPILARARREAAIHTLGNLTLVTNKLNPKMSNAAWSVKRKALHQHSVMRISTDIQDAETWDEAAIAARGERLAKIAVSVWDRPNALIETRATESAPAAAPAPAPDVSLGSIEPSDTAGPGPVEGPFGPPLAIADGVGVGAQLRRIIDVSRELGLHPRPDKYSVMVCPPSDRRVMLFTVWPQADNGGSFRLWLSPSAFAQRIPGISVEDARTALGASEGPRVLRSHDVERFLAALQQLVPPLPESSAAGDGDADAEDTDERGVPDGVARLIAMRASGWIAPLAYGYAESALARDGVRLRLQRSKGDPWYFQVRHPRFRQVVAYAHPRASELHIEYRLPSTSDTYGQAEARDDFYGIALKVRQPADLAVAGRLLDDALARED